MKKEEIRQAYEEVPFTEGIETAMYRKIVNRNVKTGRKRGRLAPVLLGIALFGTTIYAAEKMDWFQWSYGEDSGLISRYVNEKIYWAANEHLKMTVESSVFTGETGIVFLHIQTLDRQGREFMEKHKDTVYPQLEMAGETAYKSGASSGSRLLEEYSDGENWYYQIIAVDAVENPVEAYESGEVRLSTIERVEEGSFLEEAMKLSVKIPINQTVGDYLLFENCGDISRMMVSPLSVTLDWASERYAQQEIELELVLHDGSTIRYKRGSENLNDDWDSITISTDEENGLCKAVLIPKEILNLDEIERMIINGVDYN